MVAPAPLQENLLNRHPNQTKHAAPALHVQHCDV